MKSSRRAQSAMEYLMTYGWAILVIAVVLGALYQLGVFNPGSFSGKAQAGNCQVVRPNGPNTTQLITTQGVCTGQLPQFVSKFGGNGVIFANVIFTSQNAYSTCFWEEITSSPTGATASYSPFMLSSGSVFFEQYPSVTAWWAAGQPTDAPLSTVGKWQQLCGTYNGASASIYINGKLIATNSMSGTLTTSLLKIGDGDNVFASGQNYRYYFNGYLSNFQLYNSSLSSNEISAMYTTGIGGAPIRLQNLVGWWPLNGNTKDYSGDLLNGVVANSVGYVGTYSYP